MGVGYVAVQWNRQKRRYDAAIGLGSLAIFGGFLAVAWATKPGLTFETAIVRASSWTAFLLIHVILCIGPLARRSATFRPWLYNRRHLGVAMFGFATVHAALALFQFFALAPDNPFVLLFTAYGGDFALWRPGAELSAIPFEPFGALAWIFLFLMAATSHDFWLQNLGPALWKTIHLGVFVAYGLLVLHVAFGVLQSETHPAYPVVVGAGLALVLGLHWASGAAERRVDRDVAPAAPPAEDRLVPTVPASSLVEGRGRTVKVGGTRIALFLHEGSVYAMSNVCRHQGGPLGEGRIVDGCVTCPWHGWQYLPGNGTSPPPFEEKVETYRTVVRDGTVWVDPEPAPPGTPQPGAPRPAAGTEGPA